VLERAGEEQWSVLVSSHDLDEVERLVDTVAFLDAGRVVLSESMAMLQGRFRMVEVTLSDERPVPAPEPSWVGLTTAGRVVRFTETAYAGTASDELTAARFPEARIETQQPSLRQIFVALARHGRGQTQEAPR
jgi:ABC-2 type transport system ATP-binding protein